MKQKQTLFLVEIAVFSALAYLLDLFSGFLFSRIWPQGGSVSIAMVPVFLMAFRWGLKGGILTGFIFGLLQFILGMSQIYHPVQGVLDYLIAFAVLGMAGFFAAQVKAAMQGGNRRKWIGYVVAGVFIGSVLRFIAHFLSGWIFFGSYAPEGQPAWLYSVIYNGTYMLPSMILSAILVTLVISYAPSRMVQSTQVSNKI
ncbi:energy-coupled thiamine transporter ThiT [Mesobacillus boroniphilus]|uniref:Energy-coupled thiamine transporter ThiT n=1 Tax=Mesobacillus boroniphilus TaxID=308892 RepID=A0A944CGU0_9BACI|nr:energy-coupled thiamine transporter ThiT [Mesobacillus boroniphilus]MBS8262905.1 energy-coupled thiamine transporter ThiT [Mesobacillus boroniphilus]